MGEKMTLFYRKSNGDLTSFCTGEQNMDYFGDLKSDYTLIWNFIILDRDDNVLNNMDKFVIDSGVLKLKPITELNSYPIATS